MLTCNLQIMATGLLKYAKSISKPFTYKIYMAAYLKHRIGQLTITVKSRSRKTIEPKPIHQLKWRYKIGLILLYMVGLGFFFSHFLFLRAGWGFLLKNKSEFQFFNFKVMGKGSAEFSCYKKKGQIFDARYIWSSSGN